MIREAPVGPSGGTLPAGALSVGAAGGLTAARRASTLTTPRERAAELRAAGATYREISVELRVGQSTVRRWLDPEYAQRGRDTSRRYKRRIHGTCEHCGATTNYHGRGVKGPARLCRVCGPAAGRAASSEKTRGKGPMQIAAVAFLREPHRFTEISDHCGITKGHTSQLVHRLLTQGQMRRVSRGVYVAAERADTKAAA